MTADASYAVFGNSAGLGEITVYGDDRLLPVQVTDSRGVVVAEGLGSCVAAPIRSGFYRVRGLFPRNERMSVHKQGQYRLGPLNVAETVVALDAGKSLQVPAPRGQISGGPLTAILCRAISQVQDAKD